VEWITDGPILIFTLNYAMDHLSYHLFLSLCIMISWIASPAGNSVVNHNAFGEEMWDVSDSVGFTIRP
jgi:hypothetical protein